MCSILLAFYPPKYGRWVSMICSIQLKCVDGCALSCICVARKALTTMIYSISWWQRIIYFHSRSGARAGENDDWQTEWKKRQANEWDKRWQNLISSKWEQRRGRRKKNCIKIIPFTWMMIESQHFLCVVCSYSVLCHVLRPLNVNRFLDSQMDSFIFCVCERPFGLIILFVTRQEVEPHQIVYFLIVVRPLIFLAIFDCHIFFRFSSFSNEIPHKHSLVHSVWFTFCVCVFPNLFISTNKASPGKSQFHC